MTALLTTHPCLHTDAPADLLLPQLCSSQHAGQAATIALSRRHDAVITLDGRVQTPADLGRAGLSVHSAWDIAAENLIHLAQGNSGVRFWLRPVATTPWYELAVEGAAATRWLAHPRTFTLLHGYVSERLGCTPIIEFDSDTSWTIRARAGHTTPTGEPQDSHLVYRAGFPVPAAHALRDSHTPFLLAA